MLELNKDQRALEETPKTTVTQVELPGSMCKGFFDKSGPMPLHHENNRRYNRYFMRVKAVLTRGDTSLDCFTKDLSRQGIGLLSPVPLLPLERVRLQFANGIVLNLEVTRCQSVDRNCFECGTRFVS